MGEDGEQEEGEEDLPGIDCTGVEQEDGRLRLVVGEVDATPALMGHTKEERGEEGEEGEEPEEPEEPEVHRKFLVETAP